MVHESVEVIEGERQRPQVSIVTPSFNQGRFIEDTLLSVKKQDYPNIEHIIIDGGSTDNTVDTLRKYQGTYNMRWVSEPDEGQSDAINKGFRMAKGEIIGWLNSDDVYFDKEVISYVVDAFEENPGVDVIYGDHAVIDENNFIKRVLKTPGWNYNRLLLGGMYIPQPATFFRKNVVIENRVDTRLYFSMDMEFWLRLGKKYSFLHVKRILAGDRFYKGIKRLQRPKGQERESNEIRMQYGRKSSLQSVVSHYVYACCGTLCGRLTGIQDILRMQSSGRLAFNAKLENRVSRIMNQLVPLPEIQSRIRRWFGK